MLRLSPANYKRFVQADTFDVIYGGGEANVAVSLANYGHDVYFVSKLPKNEIAQSAINSLRAHGVNTDFIIRGGERIGIYFLEHGASMRPSNVIYDRKNSSISEALISEFDFDKIFKDCDWFHFTGITPALSDKSASLTLEALKAAKRNNVTVSVDLNYRKKLWTEEKARKVMTELMPYVDVCIGNEEDADKCLGFKPKLSDVSSGVLDIEGYKQVFQEMMAKFKFKYIASSLRQSLSANDNGWSALIYDGAKFYQSKKYDIHIVDRVGAGDSFAGGLIHGLKTMDNMESALEFSVAASALKHTIFGDYNLVSDDEVIALTKGDASGRVKR